MPEINANSKPLICIALICGGIALAHNFWGVASKLSLWTTRNPVTFAFTTFAHERLPKTLYDFEQDCLAHLWLAPYFLIAGGIAGFALTPRNSALGTLFTLSYAIWFSALLLRLAPQFFDSLHWFHFIPDSVWALSLTPIYLTAVATGRVARLRARPRWQIRDLLCGTAILAGVLVCISTRVFLAIPLAILILASFTAYLAWNALPAPSELRTSL